MNYQITGRIKPFRRRTVVFAAAAFAFLLAGCGIRQAQDDQFATQVAVASTEINQTIVADWTSDCMHLTIDNLTYFLFFESVPDCKESSTRLFS